VPLTSTNLHSTTSTTSTTFVRDISPFSVTDSLGHTYALPFLGGFEHPRPQLVDIDGDGVNDLFIQENSNDLALFQRTAGGWELTTERYQNLNVGEWYRFADIDGDSLVDLFTESPLSYVRYYRNVGTRTVARFVVTADTLRDVAGQAIYADRQNIAQFADIDCNGKPDLCSAVSTVPSRATSFRTSTPSTILDFSFSPNDSGHPDHRPDAAVAAWREYHVGVRRRRGRRCRHPVGRFLRAGPVVDSQRRDVHTDRLPR
jgi:hypothetical protein